MREKTRGRSKAVSQLKVAVFRKDVLSASLSDSCPLFPGMVRQEGIPASYTIHDASLYPTLFPVVSFKPLSSFYKLRVSHIFNWNPNIICMVLTDMGNKEEKNW